VSRADGRSEGRPMRVLEVPLQPGGRSSSGALGGRGPEVAR
jgi:hypothetical protein